MSQVYYYSWYYRQYAKISLLYAETTGKSIKIMPSSIYQKSSTIPIKCYKNLRNLKLLFINYGKYFYPQDENLMHNDCIQFMNILNWKLVAQEWDVIDNANHIGKGDLVFRKKNTYCIFECKRRTNTKVYEQSEFYGSAWKLKYAENEEDYVLYGIWTPQVQKITGIIRSKEEAKKLHKNRKYNLNKYIDF